MLDTATSQAFYARARLSRVWRTNIPSVAEDDMRAD
jgi:hypothetical protein